jgi:hypothetical protein
VPRHIVASRDPAAFDRDLLDFLLDTTLKDAEVSHRQAVDFGMGAILRDVGLRREKPVESGAFGTRTLPLSGSDPTHRGSVKSEDRDENHV